MLKLMKSLMIVLSIAVVLICNQSTLLSQTGRYDFRIIDATPIQSYSMDLNVMKAAGDRLQARSDANREYYYSILKAVSSIQNEVIRKELLDLINTEVGDIVERKTFLDAKDKLMQLENKIQNHLTRARQNAERSQKYEQTLVEYWQTNGVDELEGIYEEVLSDNDISQGVVAQYELALIKNDGGYALLYIYGANSASNWKPGDIKASMTATTTPNQFKSNWYMADKTVSDNLYVTFERGSMKVIWNDGKQDILFLKLYPTANDNVPQVKSFQKSSGTGFAISSNGIIVTNYHVIDALQRLKFGA